MRLLASALLATMASASLAIAQPISAQTGAPQGMVTEAMQQSAQVPAQSQLRPLARQDEIFLYEIAGAGVTEVEFGRLAQQKAAHPEVKDFARHMVEDHSKANAKLNAMVQGTEAKLPTAMNGTYRNTHAELQKMNGAAFDRAYMKAQVDDHRKVLQMLEHQAQAGTDPKLKAFAAEQIPTVRQHLEMAQKLENRVQTGQR